MELSYILSIIIGGILLLLFGIKKYLDRNRDYWRKRGFHHIERKYSGWIAFFEFLTNKKTVLDFDIDLYNQLGDRAYGGIVDLGSSSLVLKDPEIIKQILVKDFDHFVDRRQLKLHSEPVFSRMLTSQEGQEWKNNRSVMSPTFTTGKIRRMFENFNMCGSQLVEFVKSKPVGSPGTRDLIVKEAMSRYLVDVIGATAFGIETNSLKDPDSIFYKMAQRTSEFSLLKMLKAVAVFVCPFVTRFGVRITDSVSMDFFQNILKTTLKNRQGAGVEKRDDFLQLMIEAKRGELHTDEEELDEFEKDAELKSSSGGKPKVTLTDDVILAQSLLFFIAGLDTTGSVLCSAVYLLALHPEVQDKLHEEVNSAMRARNDNIDYEGINRMEYLDMFVSEILRMYPPGLRIERRCTKEYTLPGTSLQLDKDVITMIPVFAMHRDPQLYPDPDKFDPERFTPEQKAARNPYTYLPFGQGPRNCIGMRFALMEAKVAIAYLVHNFEIQPSESTPVPMKMDPYIGSRPVIDLELRFKERKSLKTEE